MANANQYSKKAQVIFAVLLLAALCYAAADEKILDGRPKTIVVNGCSTSFEWPKVLQRKLDRYFGYKRVIEVREATKGGTAAAGWMDVETGEPKQAWTEILRPAIQNAEHKPVIVLAQQSLQGAFGRSEEGIRGKDDAERIEKGADVLGKYVSGLKKDGADMVFLAMDIYKEPTEPEIGNERLALDELIGRGMEGLFEGPDLWSQTKRMYPDAYAQDGVHPNRLGAELIAHCWFVSLLAHDKAEVPPWSSMPMRAEWRIPEEARIIYDVQYAQTPEKRLLLNLYYPPKVEGRLPLIVWIHGGGWVDPNFHKDDRVKAAQLIRKGYIVASVEYRLSPEAPFPAQIYDCKGAIRWLKANAAKYNIDPNHVGVCGESAGGHLSALVGTSGDVKELEGDVGGNLEYSSRVQAVVDWFGPADLLRHAQRRAEEKGPDEASNAFRGLLGGPLEEKKELAVLASPVTHASKDDPPFLILHGTEDATVPFEQSQFLYDALKRAGVDVTFHPVEGGKHGMLKIHGFAEPELDKMVEDFFDKHLKG